MRQPTVQVRLGGDTVTTSGTTRAASDIVRDGQQNTPAVPGTPP
jgi:hypothetical protein